MTCIHPFAVFSLVLCYLTSICLSETPNFVSSGGITVRSISKLNSELYEITISTTAVRGDQKVRILLPRDYTSSAKTRRYPVLYLFHGSLGNAADWTTGGKAQTILGHSPLITVMPDGGSFGWYTNWLNPGHVAPQNWRTFHMEQLVSWIDRNLRTVNEKKGRAVIGLSMGGFGAIRYAELYSDRFAFAASFSGALDLQDFRIQTGILGSVTIDSKPLDGPFGAALLPWTQEGWVAQNPITHAASLKGVKLALYTGNQGILEGTVRDTTYRLLDKLKSLNIPVYFNDYTNGASIGNGCKGGHDFACWNGALIDVLPPFISYSDSDVKELRSWAAVPRDNNGNYVALNMIDEDELGQPAEHRAWSSGLNTAENYLGEGPTKQQRILFSRKVQSEQAALVTDERSVEHILSYIDRHRPRRRRKYRLTWRTFLNTMSGMDKIYAEDDFLADHLYYRLLFIFFDSVFRGISQVMFANNPLSGIIITVGLFIGNWELALYGLLGTTVSTFTAHVLGFNYSAIRSGLYGYNGCLTAMGIAYFNFPHSPQLIPAVVIMSIFSSIFAMAVGKVLIQKLEIAPFTFAFQISTWIWLLGSLRYRYFFIDGTILSPSLLSTNKIKPDLSNVTFPGYSVEDNFVGFFAGIAQVYFIDNPYTGAIILVGVCLCSRILAFFALFGSVTGQLIAAYLLGVSPQSIHAGLWGYNTVLTCQALGGMFFVLYGYRIWLFTLYGSLVTILLQAAVSAFLSPVGMPTLTFPFTAICWIFCLIAGSKDLIAVKVTSVSVPEDHYRRYCISQLIKDQFYFLNHITNLSLSADDELTWEELSKIQSEFLPILMCSYVYLNDYRSLKMLVKQENNIRFTDQNYRSPLHISVSQGNFKITKWLIEDVKIDVNLVDRYGNTPLFDAIWHGHFHLLAYLFNRGARLPGDKSRELAFYLNAFVYEGNLGAMKCLIQCGLNPNIGDYDGKNSLHIAVLTNQIDIVIYLVEKTRVWLDIADHSHRTAMDYSLTLEDPTIRNYLSDKVANKHNPLSINPEKQIFLANSEEKLSEKQEDKSSTKHLDEILLPSLFWIISAQNDHAKVSHFLQQFSHLNVSKCMDYDLRSIAHVAAVDGRLETIEFLAKLTEKSRFEEIVLREDRWGVTPLDEAYRNRHFHVCDFILNNIDRQLQRPVKHYENKVVDLVHKWHKTHSLLTLVTSGQSERIDGLFFRGYLNLQEVYTDYLGRTPMHYAAANGHLNVVRVLRKYGYDGLTQQDRWGNYPIDEARRNNYQYIVDEFEKNSS
ncbi:unnamed protein product [Adineta ricciae]|uniref:Uncharacterized protein n=1 Tax=Adineta ricciae TaxID=249248 RepID=A0A815ZN29_ADIRI|nr:unnamed protein product [Adineta ricciae]